MDDDVFVKPAQPKPIVEPKEHVTIECIVNKDKNVSTTLNYYMLCIVLIFNKSCLL